MIIVLLSAPASSNTKALPRLTLHPVRQADSDLEITGMVPQLGGRAAGYTSYAELRRLPQLTITVHDDTNFARSHAAAGLQVSGVPLDLLRQAVGASLSSDLIDAQCTDDYRAHYPTAYLAAHHPLFGLTIEGLPPAAWAAHTHTYNPGPYFITHARFVPGPPVLAHSEEPQIPDNLIRLNFTTQAATYGPITPRGAHAGDTPVQQGFAIAKQNCLRCHAQGTSGGNKSGRSWSALAAWAREQPTFFANYVRNPQAFEPHAHMPGNPGYDQATLAALTAYFATFAPPPAGHISAAGQSSEVHGR